jgi:hypothetical protein
VLAEMFRFYTMTFIDVTMVFVSMVPHPINLLAPKLNLIAFGNNSTPNDGHYYAIYIYYADSTEITNKFY